MAKKTKTTVGYVVRTNQHMYWTGTTWRDCRFCAKTMSRIHAHEFAHGQAGNDQRVVVRIVRWS
jgi:hypothetical protein